MKLSGSFSVMPFSDVLQWIMMARKTGRLLIEYGQASRSVFFRNGEVVACSSDDPSLLIGQFLLFHGRISEEQLQEALMRQEHSGKSVGEILVQIKAIREDQLRQAIGSKAQETIYGLFDWECAAFEFIQDIAPPSDTIEVELSIQQILLEGARRRDEMNSIQTVFHSSGMVVEKTNKRPEPSQIASPMAQRIYTLIDNKRTLEEIILASHASRYMACTFLLRLHELEIIKVKEAPAGTSKEVPEEMSLEKARLLLAHGEHDAAIRILQKMLDIEPVSRKIRMLLARAESAFISKAYRNLLPPNCIPSMKFDVEQLYNLDLSAEELFIIDLIDGTWDVKSIVWISPMRAAHVLRILKSLLDRGVIELRSDQPKREEIGVQDSPSSAKPDTKGTKKG